MKNKIITILIILLVAGCFYIYWDEEYRDKRQWKWRTSQNAYEAANFMGYGQDELSDEMIEAEAEADGWLFRGQEQFGLKETGGYAVPYTTTVVYSFLNPQDDNIYHLLEKTYAYDDDFGDWVILSSVLTEMDGSYRRLQHWRLWQGDYDIPFFDVLNNDEIIVPFIDPFEE